MRILSVLVTAALGTGVHVSAYAAGLGKLTVFSGLGQPLRAEVDVTSVSKDEEGTLAARLAPQEAFRISNMEYNPVLGAMRFALEKKPDGRQVIKITSSQPVNEPFLDLLMELNWNTGKLVREYTVLLDPPTTRLAPVDTTPAAPTISVQPAPAPVPVRPTVVAPAPIAVAPPPAVESAPAPARAPRSARAPAQGSKSSPVSGDYTVKAGDTLSSIATRATGSTVNLDQMLVAIYQGNPDAFAGNMNRLKAGSVLRVPDAATAGVMDKAEARKTVIAQTGNFGQYRDRVASGAAKAPTPTGDSAPSQSAAGSVTAKVEEQSKSAARTDQLKVGKAERGAAGSTGQGATNAAKQAELEKVAKNKATKEAVARAAELEKNVKDLKAADVKNQALAGAQQAAKPPAAAPAAVAPAAPVVPPPAAPAPAPAAVPTPTAAAPAPAPVQSANPVAAAPAAPPSPVAEASPPAPVAPPAAEASPVAPPPVAVAPVAPKPAQAPVPEPSFLDNLPVDPLMLGGGLGIAALLGGFFWWKRRNRRGGGSFEDSLNRADTLGSNSVIGQAGGQSVDTSNTSSIFSSNFMPLANQLDAGEVDPVAEADVYIAYGRDTQAEEILKDAIKEQPDRHPVRLKLLEIYAARKDKNTFNAEAATLHERTKGMGEEWNKAAAMGAVLDPSNSLYGVGAAIASSASAASPQGPMTQPAPNVSPVTLSALQGATILGGSTIMAMPPSQQMESLSPPTMPSPPDTTLDFDLGMSSLGGATEAMPTLSAPSTKGSGFSLTEGKAGMDGMMDFSLTAPMVSANELDLMLDSTNMNPKTESSLDFDIGLVAPATPAALSPPTLSPVTVQPVARPAPAPARAPAPAPVKVPALAEAMSVETVDFDLSGISFDGLGVDPSATSTVPVIKTPPSPNDLTASEMATKLNLASAYIQIGDKDGARELLNEVIAAGSQDQQQSARDMLSRMA